MSYAATTSRSVAKQRQEAPALGVGSGRPSGSRSRAGAWRRLADTGTCTESTPPRARHDGDNDGVGPVLACPLLSLGVPPPLPRNHQKVANIRNSPPHRGLFLIHWLQVQVLNDPQTVSKPRPFGLGFRRVRPAWALCALRQRSQQGLLRRVEDERASDVSPPRVGIGAPGVPDHAGRP